MTGRWVCISCSGEQRQGSRPFKCPDCGRKSYAIRTEAEHSRSSAEIMESFVDMLLQAAHRT